MNSNDQAIIAESRLSQARGLKLQLCTSLNVCNPSRLSQARGLKQICEAAKKTDLKVAPFTGAWIETIMFCAIDKEIKVAPFTGAWIETQILSSITFSSSVAPFTGAWIETKQTEYDH